MAELTGKQRRFCEEYIFDYNASRAAREAGYSGDTAGQMGWENLKKPEIQAYIKELQEDIAKTAGISKLMIVEEHKKLAFSSIAHLHNTWIERKDFDKLTPEQKDCIAEITAKVVKKDIGTKDEPEIVDVEEVKIKLYDKQKSLDSLTKLLGFEPAKKMELSTSTKQVVKIGNQTIEF